MQSACECDRIRFTATDLYRLRATSFFAVRFPVVRRRSECNSSVMVRRAEKGNVAGRCSYTAWHTSVALYFVDPNIRTFWYEFIANDDRLAVDDA